MLITVLALVLVFFTFITPANARTRRKGLPSVRAVRCEC